MNVTTTTPASSSSSSTSCLEDQDEICSVCFNEIEYFSVGICNHPICYVCSVRMRDLCDQNECPICRQDMPKVIHTEKLIRFEDFTKKAFHQDRKTKIHFESKEILDAFKSLTEYRCTLCTDTDTDRVFRTFRDLDIHCKKEHERFYCKLCVKHLQIFAHERRLYSRSQLAYHSRKGDPDDTSHRGHPLCEFCNVRFMDNELLFIHLRKDHFYCHFCEGDGMHNQYYENYDSLRDHFGSEHFLCTEGECLHSRFIHAFRTEIDYKAHRLEKHGQSLNKYDIKLNRTVDVDFSYNRRERDSRFDDYEADNSNPIPDVYSNENFPSLSGKNSESSKTGGAQWRKNVPKEKTEDDFPSLPTASNQRPASNGTRPKVKLHSNNDNFPSLGAPSSSMNHFTPAPSVTRNRNGVVATSGGTASVVSKVMNKASDFPELEAPSRNQILHSKKSKTKQKIVSSSSSSSVSTKKSSNLKSASEILAPKETKTSANLKSVSDILAPKENTERNAPKKEEWTLEKNSAKKANAKKSINNQIENRIPGLSLAPPPSASTSLPSQTSKTIPSKTKPQTVIDDFPSLQSSSKKMSSNFVPSTLSNDSGNKAWTGGVKPRLAKDTKRDPTPILGSFVYAPPSDFNVRNKQLLSTIINILGGKSVEFKEFKNISRDFRDNKIGTDKYYEECIKMFEPDKFLAFFPELISLLPDIKKQQELWYVHRTTKNSGSELETLSICDKCNQILSILDVEEHNSTHNADSDFPILCPK